MKIAVIHKSQYGTTKQYAEWIAEDLRADLFEHAEADRETFEKYDCVIYGGGLYAGGIGGIGLVRKFPCKRLVLFAVGLADPAKTDCAALLRRNLPAAMRDSTKIFPLRGGIDYRKLGTVHRWMMAALKWLIKAKPASKRTAVERKFLETYGGAVDFTNRESILPLVEYIKQQTA